MTNSFARPLLDAIGKVRHLRTGTCHYLDRGSGELMWLVDASDEKHCWRVAGKRAMVRTIHNPRWEY